MAHKHFWEEGITLSPSGQDDGGRWYFCRECGFSVYDHNPALQPPEPRPAYARLLTKVA